MLFKQIGWRIEHPVSPEDLDLIIDTTLNTLTYFRNPPKSVSVACYDLCHRILESAIEERLRWKASQLVMQIGFRHSPESHYLKEEDRVGWPATGLNFLEHQFAFEQPQESDYDTTADVFFALSTVYWDEHSMDLTKSFLSGMIASLQVHEATRLKQETIRFIRRFYQEILDAGAEVMSEEEKRVLLSAISSEVDTEEGKRRCIDILSGAISLHYGWRRYLDPGHLELLESLRSSTSLDFTPCNPELIPALAKENFLNGAILKTWLQVFWLQWHMFSWLDPEVEEIVQQAQSAIKELFIRRSDLMDNFQAAINLQTQNEDYRDDPMIKIAIDKLEEICKDVISTLHAEPNAPSTSLVV
jgi:hypothetical protein